MPEQQSIDALAEFFKIFGDPTRLKIIHILMHQELCVADLGALIQMQQPAVSQQLKILRLSRLVKYRKEGKTTYYSLDDNHVAEVFRLALSHIKEI
jgi:DNA-binding transcriptional ArsR family regulator